MVVKTASARQAFPSLERATIGTSSPAVISVPLRKYRNLNPPPMAAVAHARSASAPRSRHYVSELPPTQSSSRVSNSRSADTTAYLDASDKHQELECDYDTSATELYELLESSNWERARSRCRTHPEQVRTWIVRRDKHHSIRWRLLPLHAAIIFQAPSFVVSALLERYPAAASRQDDQGMLPLHLAFRHKHDDEDLLELLLVQYPKAVLMRDRRDRVPLDHGRESRYSAKLMRLYGQAMASASGPPSKVTKVHGAIVESHTAQTDSLTHSVSHSQLARREAEHEAKLESVKSDYEYQMQALQKKYEEKMQSIQDKMKTTIRQAELEAEEREETLVAQHNEEITELRDMLTSQVNKDRALTESLQQEVDVLQASLQDAKTQAEVLTHKYGKLVDDNDMLRKFLDKIYQDQAEIQELASKQQEYLESAKAIRSELVRTLLKQEDSDGENDRLRGTKLVAIADKVQRRIEEYVENKLTEKARPSRHEDRAIRARSDLRVDVGLLKDNEPPRVNNKIVERKGPSRIEVERGDDNDEDDDRIYLDQQGQTAVEAYYVVQGEDVVESKPEPPEQQPFRTRKVLPKASADKTEDFGEVHVLGDEISAITENSPF